MAGEPLQRHASRILPRSIAGCYAVVAPRGRVWWQIRGVTRLAIVVVLLAGAIAFSCGNAAGPDPFGADSGVRAGQGGEGGIGGEGAAPEGGAPPDLGGACLDDQQCDDGLACTKDSCDDRFERCRHEPDDAACDDGVYCNGVETCDVALGCRAGPVIACSDSDTCTIDVCVEESQSCRHEPRDADGDGDPALSCAGGDCDDTDPLISSAASERCDNGRDDDCDGEVDENDCVSPAYDRCGDALEVEVTGSFSLSTAGAARDFSLSCAAEDSFRDLVIAVIVPDGDPVDIDVVARADAGSVALAATERCGDESAETACTLGPGTSSHGGTTRLLLRAAEPGAHAVLLAVDAETDVAVRVTLREPSVDPGNATCGTALPLSPGIPVRSVLADTTDPAPSACEAVTTARFYSFTLDAPRDVHLRAASLDSFGAPVVSLRDAGCSELDDELTCRSTDPSDLFARALPAGSYVVALAGKGPSEVELVLSLLDPTKAPPGEGCGDAPEIAAGVTALVELGQRTDAVHIGCLAGAPDASFELALPERSDVMLVARGSDGDTIAALLSEPECARATDVLACEASEAWPLRSVAHGVAKGSVRAVVEAQAGTPVSLTALTRPAQNTEIVLQSDECDGAASVPPTGGRFEGTTANAYADYSASCDYGGQPAGGAPDQVLRFDLPERRRVVFDMQGSSYDTLLVVRHDDGCPGTEVSGACSAGYRDGRSFLDLVLDAGAYQLQIDGYNGDKGKWALEVFTGEP